MAKVTSLFPLPFGGILNCSDLYLLCVCGVCVHVCVGVGGVWYACIHVCVHSFVHVPMESRGLSCLLSSSITYPPYFCNLEFDDLARLAGQYTLGILLPQTRARIVNMPGVLHVC